MFLKTRPEDNDSFAGLVREIQSKGLPDSVAAETVQLMLESKDPGIKTVSGQNLSRQI